MSEKITICVECVHHRNTHDGRSAGPPPDAWFYQLCGHPELERPSAISPVTGQTCYLHKNDLSNTVEGDEKRPFCRSVNGGECGRFEAGAAHVRLAKSVKRVAGMMATRAPGGWTANPESELKDCRVFAQATVDIHDANGALVARAVAHTGYTTVAANARLLAAAPRLLRACEHADRVLSNTGPLFGVWNAMTELRIAIRRSDGYARHVSAG